MTEFTLHIPKDIDNQLRRCRASIRDSIQKRLQDIVEKSGESQSRRRSPAPPPAGPPLRFYVFEGYRVSYQVNPLTHSVMVLKLQVESG